MSRKPTTSSSASDATPRDLPLALRKNAEAAHKVSLVHHRTRGREAIAVVQTRKKHISEGFLDIGEALRVLRENKVVEALGRASFGELCERDLDMSLSKANQLIQIAERLDRPLALSLGQERSAALLALADARPESPTPKQLLRAKLLLPSGKTLDVSRASSREIRDAAADLRRVRVGGRRGRTVTAEEQATFDEIVAAMAEVPGLSSVRMKILAVGARRGADLAIRVPLHVVRALGRVLSRKT